ncbi:MAG: AI-2E family transporter YdiK [Arsenophonus sp.]|nr:MAG: AI-2E family transporter YdiK [Arsenophonus sp.]
MKKLPYYNDLPKFIFNIIAILLMIIACFFILKPFILGFLWAIMVVITTWPLFIQLTEKIKYKKWLATIIMILLIILLFVIPLGILIGSILQNSGPLIEWAKSPKNIQLPHFFWLETIPLIGSKLYYAWDTLVINGGNLFIEKLQPYIRETIIWFLAQVINIGRFVFHLIVMLLFSGLLYSKGDHIILNVRHFAFRLAGIQGEKTIQLAEKSIRAVALGVIIISLTEAIFSSIALSLAAIPYTAILSILIFIFCVAQLGPLVIMIPSIIWLFYSGATTWGIIIIIWSIMLSIMDGILRPILIKNIGGGSSIILMLIGVIGGILSFGLIGLFIGPVVLVISNNLLISWMNEVSKPYK